MRINNNITSFNAYTNLLSVNAGIKSSMEKLSSGYRINSVKDDTTGMAISNRLKTQIKCFGMADRNTLDGISITQTADGALQEIHNILQRINELSVQASNGTNEIADRKKMQDEIEQLKKEINDISRKADFNGIKLLNGGASRFVDMPEDLKINVSCTYTSSEMAKAELKYDIQEVGMPATFITGNANIVAPISGEIFINGERIIFTGEEPKDAIVEKFKELCEINNIDIALEDGKTWGDYESGNSTLMLYTKGAGVKEKISIDGDAQALSAFGLSKTEKSGKDAVIKNSKINGESAKVLTEGNDVIIFGKKGEKIELALNIKPTPEPDYSWKMAYGTSLAKDYKYLGAKASLEDYGVIKMQVGDEKGMEIEINIPEISTKTLGIENINVSSLHGAQNAISAIDKAVTFISMIRGKIGAYQNRLEYTTSSLDSATLNTKESLSRIMDTDMALEMAKLTQNNIISQSGMAILAQANQRPQQLLQLLN